MKSKSNLLEFGEKLRQIKEQIEELDRRLARLEDVVNSEDGRKAGRPRIKTRP